MKKRHPKFYFNDTWMMSYHYFLGWKWVDFVNYILKYYACDLRKQDKPSGKTLEIVHKSKGSIMMIWTKNKTNYSVLAHECLHAANYTLERAGWEPSLYNDEPQAYLMGSIFKNALQKEE